MNKKFIKTLVWISVAVGLVSFLFFTPKNQMTVQHLLRGIAIAAMYSFALGLGNGYANEFLSKKYSWVEQTQTRTILGIIITVLINVFGVFLCNWIFFILINGEQPKEFFSGNMAISNWITINIALLISAILHAKDFMEEWKKAAKTQVTEQKIIAKSANAQFESLKNQLDPHFLFNSLNVLDALIEENPQQAQRFTASMSKVYRYVLDEKDKELVTVEEELDFAKTYCELLKTRFEDSVNFEIEVNDEVKKMFVVPLSLQLLLENAIKHNFATDSKPLMIRIYSENQKLIIENNLQKREIISEREGIGLSNIVQRYSLLTTEAVTIDQSDDYFKIKLPILTGKIIKMGTTQIFDDETMLQIAKEKVLELKKFYISLIVYIIIVGTLFLIKFPNHKVAVFIGIIWGFFLALRAIRIFVFGKNWEEKRIKKIINKSN